MAGRADTVGELPDQHLQPSLRGNHSHHEQASAARQSGRVLTESHPPPPPESGGHRFLCLLEALLFQAPGLASVPRRFLPSVDVWLEVGSVHTEVPSSQLHFLKRTAVSIALLGALRPGSWTEHVWVSSWAPITFGFSSHGLFPLKPPDLTTAGGRGVLRAASPSASALPLPLPLRGFGQGVPLPSRDKVPTGARPFLRSILQEVLCSCTKWTGQSGDLTCKEPSLQGFPLRLYLRGKGPRAIHLPWPWPAFGVGQYSLAWAGGVGGGRSASPSR